METRTEIYRHLIETPDAWTGPSLGGKEALVHPLSAAHLEAIDELLKKTRHLKPQEITRADFDHPLLNKLLADYYETIMNGRGVVLIRGVTQDRYSPEDFERIYWGFGTHWGDAAVQSTRGDRLGHVREDKDNPDARGYRTSAELAYHTDSYEIVGLMCVERAESGGYSRLTSTTAIHNEIFKNRPELLPALYRGVPHAVLEARRSAQPVTPYNVPVFSCVDGKVSCLYSRMFMVAAVERTGIEFPPDFAEVCTYFEELAKSDEMKLSFVLEPGEMLVWNNFTTLHSRTKFEDSEKHQRDLLRLWLNVENGRPVVPELFTWANIYNSLYKDQAVAKAS